MEQREARPRGGAAKEIRTGHFIRNYLEKVGDVSIVDLHGALKSEIGLRNLRRAKGKWLKAPTYESFVKYFGHLRRLGLVEFVRDEPTQFTHQKLVSIRMRAPWPDARPVPETEVVPSTRRVYRLTALGRTEALSILWDDPLQRKLMRRALLG